MIARIESEETPTKTHILTKKEAFGLLLATTDYFSCISAEHVDGRHRTEVIAKTMELDGLFDQASELMIIHNIMKKFADGDARSLQYFSDGPNHELLIESVQNTKFSKSVANDFKEIAEIEKILGERSPVLLQVLL